MTSTPEVNASPSRPFSRSYETQRYDVNTIFSAPTLVTGGTFTQHNTTITSQGGFERLQDEVAATAFHNSAQRVDPPKCHPHTREAVLRHIMQWIQTSENRESWILWLNGAAGAGKSAIAQTIAEMCVREGIQLASFFFSRTDPTRNTQKSLMATISYQIAQSLPFTRDLITQAIENDPLIFQRSLEVQLEHLIASPLRQLREVDPRIISSASPFVIIIDGVDECHRRAAQIDIITTISKALRAHATPAIFLLASRNESHLIMTFNSRTTMDLLIRVALDDDYLSDDDISLYLNENFAQIKETHPLRHLIPDEWPPTELVKELVDKSSGQFIYASVVTKYVSAPNSHPVQRLEVIRGLRPTSVDTPFAQLDALYQHIFSSISNIDITLSILAYSILMRHTDIATITKFFDMPIGTVEAGLVDLSSVIACKGGYVIYLHASLPDFLLDESRSQQFYVSPSQWHTAFAHRWFVLRA
ncbi:hypothetical protein BDN70DRAFT_662104 [Pholiota conissans]|uniref:Nephrocystin 3-like N-terminal domain-containing protein n=1 Tax=Pholiota conissans TaxID=109636 RepID=A0A9P5Z1W8_9AGAR|nr:hypothetical protein BDN70DRAFT_662104 [Pholiota conissans]